MRIIQLGYGMWGVKVAFSFSSKHDTLYISDVKFNKDNLPENKPNIFYEPFVGVEELHQKISPSAYYLAVPQECQLGILKQIPHFIPVLVEKPAIGNYDKIYSVKQFRPLNTVAVGHTFLQCNGYKFVRDQVSFNKNSPVCIYSERINTNGPIRDNVFVMDDLAIHDIALFYDLLLRRYGPINIKDIEIKRFCTNKFAARFILGYKNIFIDINVSWIGPQRRRDWYVNFSNEQLHWDALSDTVISNVNELLIESTDKITPLQRQWQHLLDWAKVGSECPVSLHNLTHSLDCQYIIEQI